MKNKMRSCLFLALFPVLVFGSIVDEYLQKANTLYDMGEDQAAQKWFYKAAIFGNAEAHFRLAYQYIVSQEEAILHYTQAAKQGHEQALEFALDHLLFRANSLEFADPKRALEVFNEAKAANPDIQLYEEDSVLATMQKCSYSAFDPKGFIKKYNLESEIAAMDSYSIWEYAQEASKPQNRFGAKDLELTLNLICRGSLVPAELKYAVKDVYEAWQNPDDFPDYQFNICSYVTSRIGIGYCENKP